MWSVSPASVSQSGTETLSASPQPGTDYIYTTAYYAKGSTWLPVTLTGNNAAPSYSSGPATGSLTPTILSTLTPGTNYIVLWDWLWDASAGCYKGPGLNQCNTGTWRLQEFSLTAPTSNSCLTSTTAWQNQAIPSQTGSYAVQFDVIPNNNAMAGVIGFGQSPATDYTSLAVAVAFESAGVIDALNGSTYPALTPIPYAAGTSYHFRFDINVPARTYSVYVTPAGSAEMTLGVNYAFRPVQANTTSLNYWSFVSTIGSVKVCGLPVPTPTPTPSPTPTAGCTSNCHYISPTGSDSNAGTSAAAPWKTFAHAIPMLNAGDTLNLLNGTYPVSGSGDKFLANCTTNAHSGTSGSPITVQAVNERQAFILGNGSGEAVELYGCSHWQLIGLHVENADNSGNTSSGDVVEIYNSSYVTLRRNIAARPNRYANASVFLGYGSTNMSWVENEAYYCHRACFSPFGGSNNGEFIRNYANNRGYGDIAGGYPAQGAVGFHDYDSNGNLWENNIGEGNFISGIGDGVCFNIEDNASNSTWLGNASLCPFSGFRIGPHTGGTEPVGGVLTSNVAIHPSVIGFWNRGGKATYDHNSVFGNSSTLYGFEFDPSVPFSAYTHFVNNSTVQGASSGTGYLISNTGGVTFSFDHDNSYNNGTSYSPNQNVINPNAANPVFGSCYLWVPASSPLKGAGANGSDIGANILYAYSGGNLTNTKLWNTDGSFAGKGAIVAGLNDVAGSSLFDIQNRLNVNKNGCAFPVGY